MKRIILLTTLMATMAILFASVAFGQSTMRRSYNDLDVDIWTDKDDGSNYYEGDDITIYFRASRDCYVTIYDLDTRGNVNLLFPADPRDRNLIRGDEIYMIPDRGDNYQLTLEGPPGNETIQIVATTDYHAVPDWRGPMSVYDDDWGFKYDGDNDDFVRRVNRRYFPDDQCAVDQVAFYVAPRYYYQPEKNDCYGDCGQVYIDYPDGCEVYVNGVFFGYAPLYVPSIYLGRHRVTVYWGASIVYNDWIFVDAWHPYFVYTRPWYVYDYCYTNWYRGHVWDTWNDGPSRYKYKDRDFYSYKKPDSRRGYSVVTNTHGKYEKSKIYADKSTRIEKFKSTYNYDKSTKTYTASKGRYDYDKGKNTSSSKGRDFDDYNSAKKSTKGSGDNDGVYTKPKSGSGNGKATTGGNNQGKSGGTVKKPAVGKGSDSGKGSSGGDVKKPASKGSDNSGKAAPSSGGKKSSPSVGSGSNKSSGSAPSKSSGSSGNSGGKSNGNSGGHSGGKKK